MIAATIKFVLSNITGFLFVGAVLMAAVRHAPPYFPARLLAWLLLLSVGVENVWFGFFHMAFQDYAAATIGWKASPFQFEIGAADFSLGIVAVVSFWRTLAFKAAVVLFVTLFYIGVAVGHVHQVIAEGNFSPNNFGLLLLLTVVKIALLPALYFMTRQWSDRAAAAGALVRPA